MSFDSLLRHTLVVKRLAYAGTVDDYGQPVLTVTPVGTVRGRIAPKSAREVALVSQAGVVVSTHVGFVRPLAGLDAGCWIECAGVRYDIVGLPDAAGAGHHLELELIAVGVIVTETPVVVAAPSLRWGATLGAMILGSASLGDPA
jgi:head-tail adaptor